MFDRLARHVLCFGSEYGTAVCAKATPSPGPWLQKGASWLQPHPCCVAPSPEQKWPALAWRDRWHSFVFKANLDFFTTQFHIHIRQSPCTPCTEDRTAQVTDCTPDKRQRETAFSHCRHPVSAAQEQFLKQDDFLAFSHRLNLMTYQACEVTAATSVGPGFRALVSLLHG